MPSRAGSRVVGPTYIPSRAAQGKSAYRVLVVEAPADGSEGRSRVSWFPDEEEAGDYAEEWRRRIVALTRKTVAQAIDEYRDHLKTKGTGEISYRETRRRLLEFFPRADELQLARVTPDRAEALYAKFRERTRLDRKGRPTDEPISVSYHRATLINARSLFKWCAKVGYVAANPFADVEGVGKRNRGKLQWTGDETRRFYEHVLPLAEAGDKPALGCLMLLLMGLRSADVCRRVVRDVDLDASVLRVENGKTEESNRPRHVPEDIREPLRRLAANRDPFEPLFRAQRKTKAGYHHTRRWLEQALEKLCDAAKVPQVVPHALKGTGGSILAETGELSERIAGHLSHRDKATTEAHYVKKQAVQDAQRRRGLVAIRGGRR